MSETKNEAVEFIKILTKMSEIERARVRGYIDCLQGTGLMQKEERSRMNTGENVLQEENGQMRMVI